MSSSEKDPCHLTVGDPIAYIVLRNENMRKKEGRREGRK
jgi:hypothetical protein